MTDREWPVPFRREREGRLSAEIGPMPATPATPATPAPPTTPAS